MIRVHNDKFELSVEEDGGGLLLRDTSRGVAWRLDESSRGFATGDAERMQDKAPVFAHRLAPGTARRLSGSALEIRHPVPDGEVVLLWELQHDHALATIEVRSDRILEIAFPGSFQAEGGLTEVLLPRFQGLLTRPVGPDRYHRWPFVAMNMLGYLQQGAGLLVTEEEWKELLGTDTFGDGTYSVTNTYVSQQANSVVFTNFFTRKAGVNDGWVVVKGIQPAGRCWWCSRRQESVFSGAS